MAANTVFEAQAFKEIEDQGWDVVAMDYTSTLALLTSYIPSEEMRQIGPKIKRHFAGTLPV